MRPEVPEGEKLIDPDEKTGGKDGKLVDEAAPSSES